jgi:K+-transporting ATPase ATPase C chain
MKLYHRFLRPALVLLIMLSLMTGIVYPAAITSIAYLLFPHQANGSITMRDGVATGSELIGQPFSAPSYFWSRPSATSPVPYNAVASAGSNLGPTNPALADAVNQRVVALKAADQDNRLPIPVDLVTASASGLDPHISMAAAHYQIARVARARNIPVADVERLVRQCAETPTFGILGEARVNVLRLNVELDRLQRPAR